MNILLGLLLSVGLLIVIGEVINAPRMLRNLFALRQQWSDEERLQEETT